MEQVKKLDVTVNEEGVMTPFAQADHGNGGGLTCCAACFSCTNSK